MTSFCNQVIRFANLNREKGLELSSWASTGWELRVLPVREFLTGRLERSWRDGRSRKGTPFGSEPRGSAKSMLQAIET